MTAGFLVCAGGFACSLAACSSPETVARSSQVEQPPVAEKRPKTITVHGDSRVDDYFWLRDKSEPTVMEYLKAEDAYANAVMKPRAAFEDALYKEMVGHIKETDTTVPYRRGDYFYYSRTIAGLQYPVYCRKHDSLTAPEEIVLDLNEVAKGHTFMALGSYQPSDNGRLLAFSTDDTGYRQYTLQVKDLKTGALLPDRIERVDSVVWASDNKTVFYVTEDAVTKRHDRFFRHVVGTDTSHLVYAEPDELFDIDVARTRDGAIIALEIAAKTSTEVRYLPATMPSAALKTVAPRRTDHEYDIDHRGDQFYIRTNKDAKNFRVVTAPVADPSEKNWSDLIAHRADVKIEGISLFANHLVLSEWENGLQQIEIVEIETGVRHRVAFPEPVYAASLGPNFIFDTATLRYDYQSLVSPSSVVDYDMTTHKATVLKETEVPGGFDKRNYTTERVFASAADGVKIPISLVSRNGVPRDGSAPLLLYGYGSYGISIPPTFSVKPAAIARPWDDLRHRQYSRRRGARRAVARCRTHDEQDHDVHRLHRLG